MGVEREHLEGKVHMWETPQELPMPDSPLGKGLHSANLASPPLLHTASVWALGAHSTPVLGPLMLKGKGNEEPHCQSIS